jgi:hypothetical protein
MPVQTVYVLNMTDVGGYKVDVVHNDGISQDIDVATLPYSVNSNGLTNFSQINVECKTCGTMSQYPLAGGPRSQYLHYLRMMSLTLGEVQAIALGRGLPTTGTQIELASSIIQNECDLQSVQFCNLQQS